MLDFGLLGDVQSRTSVESGGLPKSISNDDGTSGTTFSRTSSTFDRTLSASSPSSSSARTSSASPGPAWVPVEKAGGGTCYTRKEGTTRGFGLFRR